MLKNVINALRGMGSMGDTSKKLGRGFPKTFTVNDLATADILLTQNKETIVDEYTIKPQSLIHLGFGGTQNTRNQGNIYMLLKDTGTAELNDNTEVRLLITDYNGRVKGVLLAERYANLKTGATTPSERFPFPEMDVAGEEDDKIRLALICPDAAKTLDVSACSILVSGTEYWLGK